ncbi:MAG: hypothetical protein LQ351_002758 [Letrouitia transgressa]|nr:MAG: hypothetical protein LQ351_002758 [Letrouitia transgressa]
MQINSRGALAGALFLLSTIAPFILCDVRFTSPPAGASLQAGQTLIVSWNDSKEAASLDPLASYSLFLCAGGDEAESQFRQRIVRDNLPPSNSSNDTHRYYSFLKIHAATTHGLETISLSDRFSINGMTGTFPAAVLDGLAKLSDSPALQIQKRDPQAPAAAPAGGAAIRAYAETPWHAYHSQDGLAQVSDKQREDRDNFFTDPESDDDIHHGANEHTSQ